MTHELKTINPYFDLVWDGKKRFELRKNDRDFKEGDHLILKEYDPETKTYSMRSIYCYVNSVLQNYEGLQEGYYIMSLYGVQCYYDR